MASTRIDSVLDNIKRWVDTIDNLSNIDSQLKDLFDKSLKIAKLDLKLVRTFPLCARKWSIDGWKQLEDLLFNFETSGVNLAQALNILPEQELLLEVSCYFGEKQRISCTEISEMYRTLLDLSSESNHSPVIDDEFFNFINSLLENLVDILNIEAYNRGLLKVEFEPLQEKLKFLKDLILFATWQGVDLDPWKGPMARFQVVVVQAANLSFRCWFDSSFGEDWQFGMMFTTP
nr:uncharacterized protein LOC113713376 [Coffea arabica]